MIAEYFFIENYVIAFYPYSGTSVKVTKLHCPVKYQIIIDGIGESFVYSDPVDVQDMLRHFDPAECRLKVIAA